jgi:hypothetical protein
MELLSFWPASLAETIVSATSVGKVEPPAKPTFDSAISASRRAKVGPSRHWSRRRFVLDIECADFVVHARMTTNCDVTSCS